MADYIFTIGADASEIEKAVEAAMGRAQAIASGKEILLSFTGDQKSAQAFIKQIQSLKPEATITFQSDKKSMETLLKGFENKDAFKFDPNKTGIKNSFNDLQKYVEQNLSGVNLTKYFQNISSAILDQGKSAKEINDLIISTQSIFNQLSSLKNKDALKILDEKQLDQVLAKITELNDVRDKYETARKEADKKVDQYGFTDDERRTILNRTKGEYTKKSLAEARKTLGIPETTYNGLTEQEKGEIDDYIKLSLGLKDQFKGRKTGEDFQKALKTSDGAEKLIESRKKMLDLFNKLETMRGRIGIKSGAAQELMGPFDRNLVTREMNLARDAFTNIKTSTQRTNVAKVEKELQETIIRNTERAVRQTQKGADEAQDKAERAIQRSNAKRRGSRAGSGSGTGTGIGIGGGTEAPTELTNELNNATDAADNLSNASQNMGSSISSGVQAGVQSLEQLTSKLHDAEEKLDELQNKDIKIADINKALDFRTHIKDALKEYKEMIKNGAPQNEIIEQGQHILDLAKTYQEKFPQFDLKEKLGLGNNGEEYVNLLKQVENNIGDYTPKLLESVGSVAIEKQKKLIQDLQKQIEQARNTNIEQEVHREESPNQENDIPEKETAITVDNTQAMDAINEVKTSLQELPETKSVAITATDEASNTIDSIIGKLQNIKPANVEISASQKESTSDIDALKKEKIEQPNVIGDKFHATGYHASLSTSDWTEFDISKARPAQLGLGMYFVDTPQKLSGFLDRPGGGSVRQTEMNLEKCFILTEDYISSVEDINKILGTTFDETASGKDIMSEIRKYNRGGRENAANFRQQMLDMGYQGLYAKGVATNKNIDSEFVVYDDKLLKDFSIIPKKEFKEMIKAAPEVKEATFEPFSEKSKKEIPQFENPIDQFKQLAKIINDSDKSFKEFFSMLSKGTLDLDKSSLDLMGKLGLYSNGSLNGHLANKGTKNSGVLVSDRYTIVSRKDEYLPKAQDLQPKLQAAKELGANVADIIGVVEDKTHNLIYEIQSTASGKNIDFLNLDYLEASDEQIQKLVDDIKILQQSGLYVDTKGNNILYDKEKGFSFVDLATRKESYTSNDVNDIVQKLFKYGQESPNIGDFVSRVDNIAAIGNSKSPISSEVSVLDKKVAELQYLHDKVRTIFDGKDGIIDEDMTYSEKFDSSEVQRMIELLSQLSDTELKAAGVTPDDEDSYDSFRQDLQERISLIKEAQDEIEKVKNGQSDEDRTELDLNIARQLEGIYGMAEEVGAKFESRLTPSVKEFLSLIEDNLGINGMSDFMMGNAQEIDRYINDIIHNGKSVKEVFADMENRYGWDTARFDNLIDGNVPTELKGLYDSLFSDVENRIKSAEQATEEFNAKLREFQSNETPVSEDTTTAPSPDKIEAEAKAHEDAAEAAEKHAEAAREANNVEEEKSQAPDTSNADEQTKANEQEAESARKAAKAEEERRKATEKANDVPDADSQSAKASVEEKTSAFITERETVANATDAEINSLNQLKESLKGVSESVEAKTDAFTAEQETVSSVVDAEINSLNQLKESLKSVSESVEAIGKSFEGFGKDSPFSSMFGDIKDNADTIKNFSDILKTSKEARDQAMKDATTAKEATDKVINEEKVDPGKWADFIKDKKDLDKLINELGSTVDVRRQTRVSEKTGEQYISYALKGEKGNAIIGKNGHILRTNIDEDMALSQQKEAAKQHANDVKSSYNDLISSMKEYGDAAEHVNKLQADIMSGKDVTDDEMDKALERRDKAAQNYIEKLQTIKNLVKEEGFTDKQIEGINRTADEVAKQIKDSEDNITIAANNKEYQDQIEIIQKAIEARNEYNKMLANEANGQIIPKDDRKRITDTLNEAEDAKAKALDTIKQLRDEQRISEEQFNVANTKYEKGTKASYDNLDKAMSNRVKKQEQAIERYDNAVQKVQAIQDKYNVGEATAKQLQNAIDKMNEYKTGAEEAMGVLVKMHDEGSKFVPDETIDKYRTMLDDAKETSGIFGIGDNNGFETAERGYQTLIKNAERYAQIREKQDNGQALTFNELSFLSKYGEYYKQAAENAGIFKNAQTEATESMEEFNRVMADAQNNAFQGTLEKMGDTLADLGKNTWNKEGINSLEDLNKQYDELIANANNYKDLSKEEQQAFRQRVTDFGNNISQFAQRGRAGYLTDADEKDQETLRRRMAEWMYKNSAATEYFPQIQNLQDAINGASAGNLDEIAAAFERIKTQATEAGDVGKSFGETLKGSFKGMARYLLTYADLYEVINIAKQGVNIVRELDTALTEMRKVSDEPLSVLKDFAQHGSFEAANRVGTTSKQIQESTADWLRLGESFEQAQKSAELSTVLLNVSEFQDINAATESLTAMSQAYKDLDKSEIIDKLNYVGRFCLITQ